MGLEWHNRHRDKYGRFAADRVPALVQVHIRLTAKQAEALHAAALAAHESIKGYAARAVLSRMAADGLEITDEEVQDDGEVQPSGEDTRPGGGAAVPDVRGGDRGGKAAEAAEAAEAPG